MPLSRTSPAVPFARSRLAALLAAAAALLCTLAFASSAQALSPWWHLASGAQPTYLHAGLAKDESQRLSISASAGAVLLFQSELGAQAVEKGTALQSVPHALVSFDETRAQLQASLETELYANRRGVQVGEDAGATADSRSFTITFHAQGVHPAFVTTQFVESLGSAPLSCEGATESCTGEVSVTELARGSSDGQVIMTAENVGDAAVTPAGGPVSLTDSLPAGLEAVSIAGEDVFGYGTSGRFPIPCTLSSLSCTLTGSELPLLGSLAPFGEVEVHVGVVVRPEARSGEENTVSASGGGAPSAHLSAPVTISDSPTPFGVEDYELANELEGGALDTRAGSHPFQQTTTFTLNKVDRPNAASAKAEPLAAQLPKDVQIKWPAGLIGNATIMPRCTSAQFLTVMSVNAHLNECDARTAVGVALVTVLVLPPIGLVTFPVPLFNLDPGVGEPARFGFFVTEGGAPAFIDTSVNSGGDYSISVSSNNITQNASLISAQVTVWGTPGDPRHDGSRGWGCLDKSIEDARGLEVVPSPCSPQGEAHARPFLSMPTSCNGPQSSTVKADPWIEPGVFSSFDSRLPALDGCNQLPFSPSIEVKADSQAASTPSGLTVDVHVPQDASENPEGLAGSDVKDIAVTFPQGVVVNPAAADGLQACSEGQIGFTGFQEFNAAFEPSVRTATFTPGLDQPFCPDAAKIGSVVLSIPVIGKPLIGSLYLAAQNANPFGSLLAAYILAEDPVSGVRVKLPGEVSLDQATGQITTTFQNTPQAPFEDAKIHLFGGDRAPFATPAHCGTYTTTATFTPWSGNPPVKSSSSFDITTGPNGSPCPNPLPFSPTLAAGTTNINSGAFTPLTTTITRQDGNQDIQTVQLKMPPGLSGILAGIPLCPEEQANTGTCSPASEIGKTIVSVGLGGDPFSVTGGKVYLTEKYQGAPFGLSIVNPAVAGPFDLGKVVVRAKLDIDPNTAAITVTTGQIPHILDGIPLQIKHVNVTIDRPGFTFNPTNCNKLPLTGSIGSVEGASAPVSVPFQVTNCGALKFTPTVAVATAGKASKANGASLHFKIAYPKGALGTQSWFNEAKFDIPKQLPARLTTIQKACLAATFETNRGACPSASKIGTAIVKTPVLPVPLTGPVYFVSYGGAKFPDAVLVLDGYGVHIELHGETFISGKTGVTSATFRNTPDVPFESIEVNVPTGPFSEFGANLPAKAKYSFCGQKLTMPTLFKAQNGLEIHQNTPVAVTGCPKAKTRAQKLKAALKACRKKAKGKRAACTRQARKRYGPVKKTKKKR